MRSFCLATYTVCYRAASIVLQFGMDGWFWWIRLPSCFSVDSIRYVCAGCQALAAPPLYVRSGLNQLRTRNKPLCALRRLSDPIDLNRLTCSTDCIEPTQKKPLTSAWAFEEPSENGFSASKTSRSCLPAIQWHRYCLDYSFCISTFFI